jgi:hypothetical protein
VLAEVFDYGEVSVSRCPTDEVIILSCDIGAVFVEVLDDGKLSIARC